MKSKSITKYATFGMLAFAERVPIVYMTIPHVIVNPILLLGSVQTAHAY